MLPECNPSQQYRNINGQCNNVDEGKELWGSMTISMRRILDHVNGDLTQVDIHDEELPDEREVEDHQGGGGGRGGGKSEKSEGSGSGGKGGKSGNDGKGGNGGKRGKHLLCFHILHNIT